MGLFLRQDGGRSELQTKVASDIRERMAQRTALGGDEPDDTEVGQPRHNATRNNTSLVVGLIGFIGVFLLLVIVLLIALL